MGWRTVQERLVRKAQTCLGLKRREEWVRWERAFETETAARAKCWSSIAWHEAVHSNLTQLEWWVQGADPHFQTHKTSKLKKEHAVFFYSGQIPAILFVTLWMNAQASLPFWLHPWLLFYATPWITASSLHPLHIWYSHLTWHV